MANFGVTSASDYFSFEAEGFKAIESSKEPRTKSIADAQDAAGDFDASTAYNDGVHDITVTYQLCSGTLAVNTALRLGEVESGLATSSIVISTSNGEWPKVTVTGQMGLKPMVPPEGKGSTYTLPDWTIKGQKVAQPLGFTVTTGNLTGSTATLECTIHEAADGEGEPCAHAVSGGRATVTGEFVAGSTIPAWTVEAGGTEIKGLGKTQPQAAYYETSGQYYKDLERAAASS